MISIKLAVLLTLVSVCLSESLHQVQHFDKVLNNRTMSLAGKLSITTNNIVYYDTISQTERNETLYQFDLKNQQKARTDQAYYISSFYDLKGGAKERYIIALQQIPDWSFRTVRIVAYNRVDMSYITYAYTTLQMQTIYDMAVYFDKDSKNQTINGQFKIGAVTNKGNICTWTFNIITKTATDKFCTIAHAYNSTCILSRPDSQQFITAGADSAIRIWKSGKAVFSWLQVKPITALFLSPNNILWNGDSVGTIRAYNLTTLDSYKTTNLTQHKGKIISLAVSNDSKYLASVGSDDYLILWSTQTGKILQKIKNANSSAVLKASFFIINFKPSQLLFTDKLTKQQPTDVQPQEYLYTSHADGSVKFWSILSSSSYQKTDDLTLVQKIQKSSVVQFLRLFKEILTLQK